MLIWRLARVEPYRTRPNRKLGLGYNRILYPVNQGKAWQMTVEWKSIRFGNDFSKVSRTQNKIT